VASDHGYEHHFRAELAGGRRLGEGRFRVVRALHIHGWPKFAQQRIGGRRIEHHHVIHRFQSGHELRAFGIAHQGPAWFSNRGVRVHANHQYVAERACLAQVAQVAHVQDVKHPVREDDPCRSRQAGAKRIQFEDGA
jgi:hypothetical protein